MAHADGSLSEEMQYQCGPAYHLQPNYQSTLSELLSTYSGGAQTSNQSALTKYFPTALGAEYTITIISVPPTPLYTQPLHLSVQCVAHRLKADDGILLIITGGSVP